MENLPSQKFTLKVKDFLKGLIIAVGTVIIPGIITTLNTGSLPNKAQLITTGIAGLSAALTYLLKNFVTDDVKVAEKTIIEARQEQIEKN